MDTVSYLEEQKISAGLHLEIKTRACLHLEKLKSDYCLLTTAKSSLTPHLANFYHENNR